MQAEISTSKNYGGTGLELVLSRRFCQMMGGGGADDYDIKPIEIDRFLGKIQSPFNTPTSKARAFSMISRSSRKRRYAEDIRVAA
jgi:hypothetical protein